MPDTAVNRRKGTTAQHAASFGVLAETSYDTDKKILVAHDGATLGGFPAAHLHVGNIFSQPQTIAVASGVPTIAFDILVDGLSRFQARKTGYVAVLRQEVDTSPASFELTKRGNAGSATGALSNGSGIGAMYFRGHDGTAFGDAGSVQTTATQAWAVGAHGTQLVFRTVPIGSATETTNATLNSTELSVTSRLLLPNTTSATVGGIYFGGNRAFHNFGTNNTFAGVNAGNFTMTGFSNVALGQAALSALTSGQQNMAIGMNAMLSNTTGQDNVGIGDGALLLNTTGIRNVGVGSTSGALNQTGSFNTIIGFSAAVGTGGSFSSNTIIGCQSGVAITTGGTNTILGAFCGSNLTTGGRNIVIGYDINSPTATNSNTLTIGNLIFGTGIDGTGTTISSGNVGIGVITPLSRLHVGGLLRVDTGFFNDAGGFKHARVTTGSVAAGTTALVTITWATAFADTNYTVNASVLDATTSSLSLSVVHIETITAAAVTVRVLNNAIGSLTGTVHVTAVHD